MITDEQLIWVAISQCPFIGPVSVYKLSLSLEKAGLNLLDFWGFSERKMTEFEFPKQAVASFLKHRKTFQLQKLRRELEEKKIGIVLRNDSLYPALLKEVAGAPSLLFVQGKLKKHFSLPLAVVGTRRITSYGKMVTRKMTKELVERGCEIISGFMYGVDVAAHQAALDYGGYTVAVLGYGLDLCRPENQLMLKEKILESGGALISEYLPSHEPDEWTFPQRNRIVAGMSKGVVVTEAAAKSGSKITAGFAADFSRDVFAVPGSITSQFSDGTKDLINIGAKLVASGQDVLAEYFPDLKNKPEVINVQTILDQAENEVQTQVLELLLDRSLNIDEIVEEVELAAHLLLIAVSELELKGTIIRDRGRYSVVF